jgi:DNA-binding transcriptional LysR family regulator
MSRYMGVLSLRPDLVTLKLFLVVVREGSIARAANVENIAASAISKRVTELEQILGTPLLHRMPNGVKPTEAGEALARHSANIMSGFDCMEADLSEYVKGTRGHIRVQSNSSAIAASLARDLLDYSVAYPSVAIDLEECRSSTIVRNVTDGIADIGVYGSNIHHGDLSVSHYRTINLMLVVPIGHELADRDAIRFSETTQYNYAGLPEDNLLISLVTTGALTGNPKFRFRTKARSLESLRKLVEVGVGVSIMPDVNCLPYEELHQIKCIPLADQWARLKLNVCHRPMEQLSMASRLLVKHLCAAS